MKTLIRFNNPFSHPRNPLPLPSMVDVADVLHNADVQWNTFSPEDYWQRNYYKLQAEDREIIRLVSQFFITAFADRADRADARRGIDVGSGTNIYPALLMLPWTDQILLTDFSEGNVEWLRHQIADDSDGWTWWPFWHELEGKEGYAQIGEPRKQLREACRSEAGYAGIERASVFELPTARWDLGTMFFVAESITEDHDEFLAALAGFTGALKPGAPFATALMAGSQGYPVGGAHFPALPITTEHVRQYFTELGARDLSVKLLRTKHRVRDGYEGMIVATGVLRKA
jgi:hypothetical protein